jgi:hypothetical protein
MHQKRAPYFGQHPVNSRRGEDRDHFCAVSVLDRGTGDEHARPTPVIGGSSQKWEHARRVDRRLLFLPDPSKES